MRLINAGKSLAFSAFTLAYALFEVPSGWLASACRLICSRCTTS